MKKISGIYRDSERFTHTVFYHPNERKYVKIIANPAGKFCSSNRYTKDQIIREVSGMTKVS